MNQNENYEDVDLSGMLKNSRPSVEFDEQKNASRYYGEDAGDSKMVKLVIKNSGGLIKNGTQANFVLLGIAVVAVILSIFLLSGGGKPKSVYNKNMPLPGAMPGMPIKNM